MKQHWLMFRVWLVKKILACNVIIIGCDIESSTNGIKIKGTQKCTVVGNTFTTSGV